jgi:glycosyltransferase involved in cell wall biosynthesis
MDDITNSKNNFNAKVCLQVLPELDVSGVSRGTLDLSKAIVSSGRKAIVASNGGVFAKDLNRIGVKHYKLSLASKFPLFIIKNALSLAKIIKKESVSIVHARSRAPAWSAYLAAKWMKKPFVTTFHGAYSLGPLGIKKKYNQIMTKGDAVIAISKFIHDHILAEYNLRNNNTIFYVPRGVDLNIFNSNNVSAERIIQMSQEWRLSDNIGPVIMLPGRLTSWKGQVLFLEAVKVLLGMNKLSNKLRCLLVGPSDKNISYRTRLDKKIKELGLNHIVQIVDDCKDIASAYMLTDVVVSASLRPEAFGRIVAEAQAMGRPVVAPDHGAAPEIIKEGVTGWLFKPGNVKSLAGTLDKAISIGADEREDLSDIAKKNIVENFSLTKMVNSTIGIYEETIVQFNA